MKLLAQHALVFVFGVTALIPSTMANKEGLRALRRKEPEDDEGNLPKKLAHLELEDGLVISFFEHEENGLVTYMAEQKISKDVGLKPGSGNHRGRGGQAYDLEKSYSSPVEMFEKLSGQPAPSELKKANNRLSTRQNRGSFEDTDPPKEEYPVEPHERMLKDGVERELAGCPYQNWWESEKCTYSQVSLSQCRCFSCWRGVQRTEWTKAENFNYVTSAHVGDVTISVDWWNGKQSIVLRSQHCAQGKMCWWGSYNNKEFWFKSTASASSSARYNFSVKAYSTTEGGRYQASVNQCSNSYVGSM